MDKVQLMLSGASFGDAFAAVFAGGIMIWAAPATWRAAKRGTGWVKAKFAGAADSVSGFIDDDRIDWDAVALGGDAGCPECWGADRAQASQSEVALLRAVNTAGREEMSQLRHKLALAADAITAADRRITALQAELVAASREVERLLRERSMAKPAGLKRASARVARAVPGVAMGDA